MKKNLFYLFALICSMSLFTACSDDDDAPDYSKVIDSEIAGNYKGTLTVSVEGTTMPAEPQKITIEKASPSAINLSLKNFSFMGISIGDVELKNCILSQNGDTYTFTGTQDLKVDALSCTINAKGTVVKGQVKVDMDIDANAGGVKQKVAVVYQGTRLSGSESSEVKITAFSFDMSNEANAIVIEQPVINDDNTITFRVDEAAIKADPNVLKTLVPTFTISDKATSSVESGKAMDLSKNVTITLLAEDGTLKEYVVKSPTKNSLMKFTFDEWAVVEPKNNLPHVEPIPQDILATPNKGAEMLNGSSAEKPVGYPVMVEENGYVGKAAKLITRDARGSMADIVKAYITAGSIFTGEFSFSFSDAMKPGGALKMTHFGVIYDKKPLSFRGMYKYAPGSPFIKTVDGQATTTEDIDECAIQAVLYTITSEDETLDGTNIDSEDARIVARAQLQDGSAKADWTTFNLEFKWKEGVTYNAENTYKLAIVCSSSKDGANFNGAANSTLIVDELEVIGE